MSSPTSKRSKLPVPLPAIGGRLPEGEGEEKRMSFTEHLAELRVRLIRALLFLGVAVILCYVVSDYLLAMLKWPLDVYMEEAVKKAPAGEAPQMPAGWIFLHPFEPLFVSLRLAAYGGLLVSLPFIMWEACSFIFPGLTPAERRAAKLIVFGCSTLAVGGVLVAYFGVLPFVLYYLAQIMPPGFTMQLHTSATLSIIIQMLVAFAIAFQFPMIVLVLVYVGLLDPDVLVKYRRVAIVGLAVMAAVFTPPDPFTMTIMLIPLVALYELSIWAGRAVVRRREAAAEAA